MAALDGAELVIGQAKAAGGGGAVVAAGGQGVGHHLPLKPVEGCPEVA